METILDRAQKFDRLISQPGWIVLQEFIADKVNAAIIEAAEDDPLKAELQRLHVIRWNAKRELNDSALAYIAETRKLRDEIVGQQKKRNEQERYGNTVSYAGSQTS